MRIDRDKTDAIDQYAAGERGFEKVWIAKGRGNQMLRGTLSGPRLRIGPQDLPASLIITENPIGHLRELIAIGDRLVHINGDHVAPFSKIAVISWGELVLAVLRPTVHKISTAKIESHSFFTPGICGLSNRRRHKGEPQQIHADENSTDKTLP